MEKLDAQLASTLKILTDKLGVGAPRFYELTIHQVTIEAISNFVIWLLLFILMTAATYLGVQALRGYYRQERSSTNEDIVAIIMGIGTVLSLFLSLVSLDIMKDQVIKYSNPEFAAVERITETLIPKHSK